METAKTIVKIRAGYKTRQTVTLAKVLILGLLPVALIAGAQVGWCKFQHSDRSVVECMRPQVKEIPHGKSRAPRPSG